MLDLDKIEELVLDWDNNPMQKYIWIEFCEVQRRPCLIGKAAGLPPDRDTCKRDQQGP